MRPSPTLRAAASLAAASLSATSVPTATIGAQPASIVYRLGTDTVAIESYARTGNRIAGDMVQRAGNAVVRVQYDVTLGGNGYPVAATIRRMNGDGSPIANAPGEARFRFTADSMIRETVFADSVQRRAFAARNGFVSFPVYLYGPFEALHALRRGGKAVDSLPALGFAGPPTATGLAAAGADTLRQKFGPYAMRFRFDGKGNLLSVDGSNTTNKILGTRVDRAMDIATIGRRMKPTGTLSARDIARGAFGSGGMVLVDYSRPLVRERTVWGGTLVPFDSIWRAGANDATHLFTTRTLTMGSLVVPPGMYTLWVQHGRTGTNLIVNKGTGQWGTQYDPAQDLGRVPMTVAATPSHVEEFTITVRALPQNRGAIEMAWGPSALSVPFAVSR